MAEYRYYLIPDAMTRAFPEKFEKQTPTEFFDNIADLEKRYHQLREMPYNNERTWNERARFPYARLVVGVDQFSQDRQYVDDLILNFEKSFFRRGVSDKQQVGKA